MVVFMHVCKHSLLYAVLCRSCHCGAPITLLLLAMLTVYVTRVTESDYVLN